MRTTPPPFDGPGVIRPLDALTRAIDAASMHDVALLTVMLARRVREETERAAILWMEEKFRREVEQRTLAIHRLKADYMRRTGREAW